MYALFYIVDIVVLNASYTDFNKSLPRVILNLSFVQNTFVHVSKMIPVIFFVLPKKERHNFKPQQSL